jgi:hypothetical protein
MEQEMKVDYNVVSEFAGHKENRGVNIVKAAEDIFKCVKEKAMELAIKGEFITFQSIEELQKKLEGAVQSGFNISVYDEVVGG